MKIKQCSFVDYKTMKKVPYQEITFDDKTRVYFYPRYRDSKNVIIKNGLWIMYDPERDGIKVLYGEETISFLVEKGPLFSGGAV